MNPFVSQVINVIKKKINLKKNIPLHEPTFEKIDYKLISSCIKSNFVSTAGKYVSKFEEKLKKYTNSKFVIATINGTSALHVCLRVLNVNQNDEILMPSLTFVGTANAIKYCGATPNFVEICKEDFGIDHFKLENYLKKTTIIRDGICKNKFTNKTIKALICVHIFGNACKIDKIISICKVYKIKVIEDAAEAIGSYYKKKHLGTLADFGILSFNGNKTITTGGGGAILTSNKKMYKRCFKLVNVAKENHPYEYFYKEVGYNYRMPSINAALGVSQLKNINTLINKKRKLYLFYKKTFNNINGIKILSENSDNTSNYWLQTLILKGKYKKFKNQIIKNLIKNNFTCRPLWIPMHKLKHFKSCPKDNLSITNLLYRSCINLPSSPNLLSKIIK